MPEPEALLDGALTPPPWELGSTVSVDYVLYSIEKVLGGGMGDVYLARRNTMRRGVDRVHLPRVAIKTLKATEMTLRSAEAFLRELNNWIQLKHHHILNLLTIAGHPPLLAAVMPVASRSLREILDERKKLPLMDVRIIVAQVVAALRYAHEVHGLVHLDLKPENILVDFGAARTPRYLVSDWGISATQRTRIEEVLSASDDKRLFAERYNNWGTLPYMSPERFISGFPGTPLSDIYALGMMTFELLTGQLPFERPRASIPRQIVSGRYLTHATTVLKDHTSTRVRRFLLRAIAPDIHRRYQDYNSFEYDLRRLVNPLRRVWESVAGI